MHTRTVALVVLSLAACGPSAGHGSAGGDGDGLEGDTADDGVSTSETNDGTASASAGDDADNGASTGADDWPGIVDQSGGKFLWTCDDDECQIERVEGISPRLRECEEPTDTGGMEGSTSAYDAVITRFFGVLAACHGDNIRFYQDHHERYLVCSADNDCAQPVGGPAYACHAGFCQDVERIGDVLTRREVFKICYGDVPRFDEGAAMSEYRTAIEAACPGDGQYSLCETVPEGCRDPR